MGRNHAAVVGRRPSTPEVAARQRISIAFLPLMTLSRCGRPRPRLLGGSRSRPSRLIRTASPAAMVPFTPFVTVQPRMLRCPRTFGQLPASSSAAAAAAGDAGRGPGAAAGKPLGARAGAVPWFESSSTSKRSMVTGSDRGAPERVPPAARRFFALPVAAARDVALPPPPTLPPESGLGRFARGASSARSSPCSK